MGLLQILNGEQNHSFYGGNGVNSVSFQNNFGQRRIGYVGGSFLPKSEKPYITIPIPDTFTEDIIPFNPNLNGFSAQNPSPLSTQLSNSVPGITNFIDSIFAVGGTDQNNSSKNIRYQSNTWGQDFLNRGNLFGFVRARDDLRRITSYYFDGNKGLLFTAKQNLLSRVGTGFGSETPKTPANLFGFAKDGVYSPTSTLAQVAISGIGGHLNKQGIDPTGLIPFLKLPKYQEINRENPEENGFKGNRLVKKLERIAKNEKSSFFDFKKNIIEEYGGGPGSFLGIGRTRIKYGTDSSGKNKSNAIITKKDLSNKFEFSNGFFTWDNEDFNGVVKITGETFPDFRTRLIKELYGNAVNNGNNTFLSLSPDYRKFNIEKRLNYRSGGAKGNILNYTRGKRDIKGNLIDGDKINLTSIYNRPTVSDSPDLKDLCNFRIGVLDNSTFGDTQISKNWIHFRALLKGFKENYKASWKSQEYMGRAEKFYRYNSFDRDISFSFDLVSFSKQELMPIYKKLNYLASTLAPYYSDQGYMQGNIVQLTIGDYLHEQPGFISSIGIDIDDDAPWEVNLGLDGEVEEDNDTIVRQVPHRVQVSINFTPIHTFRPEVQELFGSNFNKGLASEGDNIDYGDQKYIALKNNIQDGDGYKTPLTGPIANNQLNSSNQPNNVNNNTILGAAIQAGVSDQTALSIASSLIY